MVSEIINRHKALGHDGGQKVLLLKHMQHTLAQKSHTLQKAHQWMDANKLVGMERCHTFLKQERETKNPEKMIFTEKKLFLVQLAMMWM